MTEEKHSNKGWLGSYREHWHKQAHIFFREHGDIKLAAGDGRFKVSIAEQVGRITKTRSVTLCPETQVEFHDRPTKGLHHLFSPTLGL